MAAVQEAIPFRQQAQQVRPTQAVAAVAQVRHPLQEIAQAVLAALALLLSATRELLQSPLAARSPTQTAPTFYTPLQHPETW